jgi:hypothetical protein
VKTSRRAHYFFLCLAAFSLTTMTHAQDADLGLTNANIYTVSEKQPKAEAIAVKGDDGDRWQRYFWRMTIKV